MHISYKFAHAELLERGFDDGGQHDTRKDGHLFN